MSVAEGSAAQQSNQAEIFDGCLFDCWFDVNLYFKPLTFLLIVLKGSLLFITSIVFRNALLDGQIRQMTLCLNKSWNLHMFLLDFLGFLKGVRFETKINGYK